MGRYMMQFKRPGVQPTLDEVKTSYGLDDDDIDPNFGVVLIDPRDGTYAVRVAEKALEKFGATKPGSEDRSQQAQPHRDIQGPYSDPTIEPAGPPERKRDGAA